MTAATPSDVTADDARRTAQWGVAAATRRAVITS